MRTHTIGSIARAAGVAPSTIRYYEEIGLLPEPERQSGRRRYGDDVRWRLSLIQGSKRAGFTLREIKLLLDGFPEGTPPGERWRALAGEKQDEIDRQITELERIRARLDHLQRCDCASLSECGASG